MHRPVSWRSSRTLQRGPFVFVHARRSTSLQSNVSPKLYHRRNSFWRFYLNVNCHKRGSTSGIAVEAKVQTSCNFEANLCGNSIYMAPERLRCNHVLLGSFYFPVVWLYTDNSMFYNLIFLVHKNLLNSSPSSKTTRTAFPRTTAEKNWNSTEYSTIQKNSVHSSLGAVNISSLLSSVWYSNSLND